MDSDGSSINYKNKSSNGHKMEQVVPVKKSSVEAAKRLQEKFLQQIFSVDTADSSKWKTSTPSVKNNIQKQVVEPEEFSTPIEVKVKSEENAHEKEDKSHDKSLKVDDSSVVIIKNEKCVEVEDETYFRKVDLANNSSEYLPFAKAEAIGIASESAYGAEVDTEEDKEQLTRDSERSHIQTHDTVISINALNGLCDEFVDKLPKNFNVLQFASKESKNKRLLLLGHEMLSCPKCKVPFKISRTLNYHFANVHKGETELPVLAKKRTYSQIIQPFGADPVEQSSKKKHVEQSFVSAQCGEISDTDELNKEKCCPICGIITDSWQQHFLTHTSPQVGQYMCLVCEELYPTNDDLAKHMENHHMIESQCPKRDKSPIATVDLKTLNRDKRKYVKGIIVTTHSKETSKKINKCNKHPSKGTIVATQSEETSKKIEKRNKGRSKEKHICPICGIAVQFLRKHMKIHNRPEVKKYMCDTCKKLFLTEDALTRHIEGYHVRNPQRCPQCNKNCKTAIGLKIHIRMKHSDDYHQHRCDICGEQFARLDQLKRHLTLHVLQNGDRSEFANGPVSCKYCSKEFSHVTLLRNHLLSHVEDPSYKCKICGRSYATLEGRTKHLKKHKDPNYTLSCKICGHNVKTVKDLQEHLKVHDE